MSFQGIVTDVEKCQNVSKWEAKALFLVLTFIKVAAEISFLSDRDSLPK